MDGNAPFKHPHVDSDESDSDLDFCDISEDNVEARDGREQVQCSVDGSNNLNCVDFVGDDANVTDNDDSVEEVVSDMDSVGGNHESSDGEDVCSNNSDNDNDHPVLRTDAEKEQYAIDTIRDWAQQPGLLSMTKLDDLLHRMKWIFPRMPLTYTTLFQCDYDYDITELPSGGRLWYKGISCNLKALDLKEYLQKFGKIIMDIGIDGLPVVGAKLWPILGHLVGTDNCPFIIAVYRGPTDPKKVHEFLKKYCDELKELLQNGFTVDGQVFEVQIRYYMCDAPARAFLKCIVHHNGYEGCEKCTIRGEYYSNRVVLLDLNHPLRTDQAFQQRLNPVHHRGDSPLEDLGTKMVSQFPLDTMHLLYAGVFSRLMEFWLYNLGPWKLHTDVVNLISLVFEFLRPYCPGDFNRKPCSLKYFKSLKCTQLRRMLLYDGILAFKDLVDDNVYKHFLLLHCSMYILSSKRLIRTHGASAKEFGQLFISHAAAIYGREFVVYNVHSLIRMIQFCTENLMTLEECSAFKYENRLKMIKDTLKSGLHQLQQLARRDEEKQCSSVKLTSKATHVVLSVKQKRVNAGVLVGQHYKRLKCGTMLLRVGKANGCFKTSDGYIVVLHDIVLRQRKIYLIGRKFRTMEDFYDYPIASSELGIVKVSDLERRNYTFRLKDVDSKCYLMPDGDHYLCVPILHSSESI